MDSRNQTPGRSRQALARFWLRRFFWLCSHAPWAVAAARPLFCAAAFAFSPAIRRGTRANAVRLLGPQATAGQRNRLARATLNSFYLFCCDMGQSAGASAAELRRRVEEVAG